MQIVAPINVQTARVNWQRAQITHSQEALQREQRKESLLSRLIRLRSERPEDHGKVPPEARWVKSQLARGRNHSRRG